MNVCTHCIVDERPVGVSLESVVEGVILDEVDRSELGEALPEKCIILQTGR